MTHCLTWIPRILRDSNVHYRAYNSPKLATILCHMNPTHAVTPYSLKTNYNATLQSAPTTPQVVYLLRVSQPKLWRPKHFCSIPSHACHILRPSDLGVLTSEETSFTRSECPRITRGCICQLPTYFISSSLVLLVRCLDLVSSHATQADCTRSEQMFSKVRLIKTNTLQLTWLPTTKPQASELPALRISPVASMLHCPIWQFGSYLTENPQHLHKFLYNKTNYTLLTCCMCKCIFLTSMWPCIVTNFFIIKPTRCTNFANLFLAWNSTCFGRCLCPSSGVHSLYTQQWYMS